MDVILYQPQPMSHPFTGAAIELLDFNRAAPAWRLMTLQMMLSQRSMHNPVLFDSRIKESPQHAFIRQWRKLKAPGAVILYIDQLHLADTIRMARWLKKEEPELTLLAFGSLADAYPAALFDVLPVDYMARGDAEIILRKALDNLDNPTRLAHLSGLASKANPTAEPFFAEDLDVIPLPDWRSIDIADYKDWFSSVIFETDIRLSIGNSRLPPDGYYGEVALPHRRYDLQTSHLSMQASSGSGASHAFIADPPAVWSAEALADWCQLLKRSQNQQVWGFRLLPTYLDEEEVEALDLTLCRRVEFIFPSTTPDGLASYGCIIDPRNLRETIAELHAIQVHVTLRFLLGRPNEPAGEAGRIVQIIDALDGCDFELHPYPCLADSVDYQDTFGAESEPRFAAYLAEVAKDLDTPPYMGWEDPEHVDHILSCVAQIQRRIATRPMRNPVRSIKRLLQSAWNAVRHSLRGGGPEGGVEVSVTDHR